LEGKEIFMTEESQVIPQGDQGTIQPAGWISALPDEYKNNDYVKTFQKPGDFVKSALEIKTERDTLNGKLGNAIFKPGENATPEEMAAYHKALGVPDKPDEYEFAKLEGQEHDPKFTEWAKGVFGEAKLTKAQATTISQKWGEYVKAQTEIMAQQAATEKADSEKAIKETTAKLQTEWGAKYNENIELVKRGFQKFSNKEFNSFCDETGIGNNPDFIRFIFNVGKAMGEDFSPKGSNSLIPEKKSGFQYTMPDFG
jgi:hypothetical protein